MSGRAGLPGLVAQLSLLWRLRWDLARGASGSGAGAIPGLAGMVVLLFGAVTLAVGTRALLLSDEVLENPSLERFLVLLVAFLAGTMWVTWPVVTAGVDDAAELSRFALFPISSGRLFLASVLAGLVEPRTWILWGALLGAGSAMASAHGTSPLVVVVATLLLAVWGVSWGRAGLHLLMNVLQNRRSAEAMGGGLLVMLGLSALVPPPDLSWVSGVSAGQLGALDGALIAGGTIVFTLLPTGGWSWALLGSATDRPWVTWCALGYLVSTALIGYGLALVLLERFHRRAARALPQQVAAAPRRSGFGEGTVARVLVERELRDALLNPRVRLMLALPFFLAILLKLVGARALATAALGPQADAWLFGGIASYGALVLGAGLAQNAFGYDGGGATLLLGAPVSPGLVLRAKNVVSGGLALASTAAVLAFSLVYVGLPAPPVVVIIIVNALFQVLLLTAVGNVLSILFPMRFHASLRRRDRPPAATVGIGLAAASAAVLPGSLLLHLAQPETPGVGSIILLAVLAGAAALLWRASLGLAVSLLERRRPELLRSVGRD